ncbi:MAG: hypothetical protein HYS13_18380 [Planctomycetia bacterium]|nr:hypothetical protein [Planctomycetia bacterium]
MTSPAAKVDDPRARQQEIILSSEARNLVWLALHQVVFRVGWIFKTESVIMPAVLDAIAVAAGLAEWRAVWAGFLPVLNRFGQSVPPVLFAGRLTGMRRKKISLIATTLLMGLPLLGMALPALAHPKDATWTTPALFLLLYGAFFCLAGLNSLSFNSVQGKLIQPARRGRLLALSASVGSVLAVLFAWWLMESWLEKPFGFSRLFAFTGACFLISGLCVLIVREPPDEAERQAPQSAGGNGAAADAPSGFWACSAK